MLTTGVVIAFCEGTIAYWDDDDDDDDDDDKE